MYSSSFFRRGASSKDVADSGRIHPLEICSGGGVTLAEAETVFLRWNIESMECTDSFQDGGPFPFPDRAFPLTPIPLPSFRPFPLSKPLHVERRPSSVDQECGIEAAVLLGDGQVLIETMQEDMQCSQRAAHRRRV